MVTKQVISLFWAEQGVGDEVMFASCFSELLNFCDKLTVSIGPRLLPLFARSLPKEINIVERSVAPPDIGFDCHAPAMTALGHLRKKIEDFETGKKPWLVPDAGKVEMLRSELAKYSGGKKIVGLSWHTKSNQYGAKRSLPLIDIAKNLDDDLFLGEFTIWGRCFGSKLITTAARQRHCFIWQCGQLVRFGFIYRANQCL